MPESATSRAARRRRRGRVSAVGALVSGAAFAVLSVIGVESGAQTSTTAQTTTTTAAPTTTTQVERIIGETATQPDLSNVPTGSDPQTINRFFDWLYGHYMTRIPNSHIDDPNVINEAPQWELQWAGPFMQEFTTAAALIFFFFAFAFWFNRPHRPRAGLYRPTEYAGAVPERHGAYGPFSWLVLVFFSVWALYYIVEHIVTGQVY